MLSIALSKGRILEETLPLLKAADIVASEDPDSSRKLIIPTSRDDVRLIIVRATDVPTYVQYGAADLGVAGGDEGGVGAGDVGTADLSTGDLASMEARTGAAPRRGEGGTQDFFDFGLASDLPLPLIENGTTTAIRTTARAMERYMILLLEFLSAMVVPVREK